MESTTMAGLGDTEAGRPEPSEAAPYYFPYIDLVPAGNISDVLASQLTTSLALFQDITAEQALHRYAPGKWSIADTLNHLNDAERLFVFRAWWFARGFELPLPSFDQNIAAIAARAEARPWTSHVDEFNAVRLATLAFYRSLAPEAWLCRGSASGNTFTVRALAYITAGHLIHHNALIRERYLRQLL
jgi:hypothetical protein